MRLDDDEFRDLRIEAAHLANETLAETRSATPATARTWADFWFGYITAPQATAIRTAVTVTGSHGHVKAQFTSTGGTMADAAMTMDDTITLAATPEDDHGDITSDTLSFSASDAGTVLSFATSGDTSTGTPVAEGTSTVTVSDPSAPNAAAWVVNITVGPGATSSIQGTVTVNTGANAAPPAG